MAEYCYCAIAYFRDEWLPNFPEQLSDVFNSICTVISDTEFMDAVMNTNFHLEYHSDEIIDNFESCSEVMKKHLTIEECSNTFEKCFNFKDTQNIPEDEHFYALSAYYWDFWKYFNISKPEITFIEAQQKIGQVCNQPQQENHPTDCFKMTYIFNVLTHAYKIQVSKY